MDLDKYLPLHDKMPLDYVRSPHNNAFLTKGLFVEHRDGAVLSFRRMEHGDGVLSLHRLFVHDHPDLTEYDFAMRVLGNWEHWTTLCESHFFKEYIEKWRLELKQKLLSQLFNSLYEDALDETSKSAASSAKFLIEQLKKDSNSQTGKKVVRKQDTTRGLPGPTTVSQDLAEDYKRIKRIN